MDEDELREIEAARDYPLFDGVDAQQALALVAEVRRLRAALRWCLEEGGWRLTHYQLSGPPPEGVFDLRDPWNPRLAGDAP